MASPSEPQLQRVIGVRILSASVLNMVVGAGIFSLPALVGAEVGAAAPLAFAVCALAIGVVMLCFAIAGSRVDGTGGAYAYAGAAFGPLASFQVGILLCFAGGLTSAAIANSLVTALAAYLPAFGQGSGRIVVLALLFSGVALVNVLGVKQGGRLVEAVTVAKLAPLLCFVAVGLFAIQRRNIQWPGMPNHRALEQAVLTLMFGFMGAESALTVSGEVKRPTRTVPLALLLGIGGVAVLYMGVQLVAQGVLGHQLPASKQYALADSAVRFLGPGGAIMIMTGLVVSSLGLVSGDVLATPRALHAFGLDGFLPRSFARLHPRFGTPYLAISVYAAAVFATAASSRFEELANRTVVMILFLYLVTCAAAWRLQRQDRRSGSESPLRFPGSKLVPLLAIGIVLWLLTTAARADLVLALGVILATSAVYWAARASGRLSGLEGQGP